MNILKKIILIIVLPLAASGCGEVSYKRGASVRDVETAHAACRGVSESEFSNCLQQQGWEIQKFDDSDLFAETSVTDNRGTPPEKAEKSAFVEVQAATNTNSVVESEAAQTIQLEQTKQTAASNTNEATTSPASATVVEAKTTTKTTPTPVDPLKTYKINSWWKFGGTPAHLKTDQSNCVATLGEAHQPDMSTQTYTRGLIECLHKNGWKALKAR